MKVTVAHGGTLVPIVVTTEADTAVLAPEHAEHLHQLVKAVGPLEDAAAGRPAAGASPAQPDRGAYRVTIEDGSAVRRTVVREADAPAPLRELIDFVGSAPGATRRTGPMGSADPG